MKHVITNDGNFRAFTLSLLITKMIYIFTNLSLLVKKTNKEDHRNFALL